MSVEIEELRRRFFPPESSKPHQVFQVVVTEIDETNLSCTVRKNDEINYYDVRLQAVINEKLTGAAFIPKIGSIVLVARIGNSDEVFITRFSEIEKIIYTAGENKKISFSADLEKAELKWGDKVTVTVNEDTVKLANDQSTFEMKGDKIVLNGGESGGLVLVEKLEQNLNNLKQFVEDMHKALPAAFEKINIGEKANGPAGKKSYETAMETKSIQFENMENDRVKQ